MDKKMAPAKTVLLVLAGLLWLGGAEALAGAPTPPVTSTQSVYLAYRELGYNVATWRIPVTYQPSPFKKEPDLGNRAALRGTLKFGNTTDAFVPFLWDSAQGKLYLDLNRNQDLTDDADGVFACTGRGNTPFQFFDKVRLPFKTPMGPQRVLVELFFDNTRGQKEVSAMANYCWEGKVTQAGREWQLALVDNLSFKVGSAEGGFLIARPWADRDRPIELQYGPLETPVPFPNELFLGERVCQLACVYEQQGVGARMRLDLIERAEPLGELKITGKYIHRLVLSRAGARGMATPSMAAQEAIQRRYVLRSGALPVAAQPPSLTVVLDTPGPVANPARHVFLPSLPRPGRGPGPADLQRCAQCQVGGRQRY